MAFNKNELILDRVRSLSYHDPATNKMMFRLTQLEDPTINCTAEGEEVTDAVGALITTMYRAKTAEFTATNSLFSTDLAAAQFGAAKKFGTTDAKLTVPEYDILTVDSTTHKVTLSQTPKTDSVQYVYVLKDGEISTELTAGSTASATEFVINGKEITLHSSITGTVYVEYEYETADAFEITNRASEFPQTGYVIIYAYFRDKCNDNIKYSGRIICPRAKLDAEQVEIALTSTGKHAFTLKMAKDYCASETDDKLFNIIISQ